MTAQSVQIETTKAEKKTIPSEIKTYIKFLHSISACRMPDKAGKDIQLFDSIDQTRQPFSILSPHFHKLYRVNYKFDDYLGYVINSLEMVVGQYFEPQGPKYIQRGVCQRLNKYRSYKPTLERDDYKDPLLFIELLERLTPDPVERKYFTQWLAHTLQRPQERPTVAVMLTGLEGTGKGLLFNYFLTPLLMQQTAQCSTFETLTKTHSTALADCMVCMLDDCKSNSENIKTQLKSKISEPTVRIDAKHETEYVQTIYARILLASNESRPIRLGENDTRRWFVPAYIKHKVDKSETNTFRDSVFAWLADTEAFALDHAYYYLMNVDLSDFDPFSVSVTETLKEMVELSTSSLEQEVRDVMDSTEVFQLETFLSQDRWSNKKDLVKSYIIDYWKTSKKVDIPKGAVRRKWWIKPDMSNAEARNVHLLTIA